MVVRTLQYSEQANILRPMASLAESSWSYLEALSQQNWTSCIPHLRLYKAFCEGEAEYEEWQRATIERLKIQIATPNFRYQLGGMVYSSSYLSGLAKRRDRILGRPFDINSDPIWLMEVDSCSQRMARLQVENRNVFDELMNQANREQQLQRDLEVALHGVTLPNVKPDNYESILHGYREISDACLRPLGFSCDDRRSDRMTVVYSKPLLEEWSLCMSAEPLRWNQGVGYGNALTLMSLRSGLKRGPIRTTGFDKTLLLEFSQLIYRFDLAYNIFRTLAELEVVVRGRSKLLELVLPEMQDRLKTGLKEYI